MKLLASDLDGTLVGRSGDFSGRTRAMLAACDAAGIPVVFVTGRPPRWIEELAEGRVGAAICANGALIIDLSTRTFLEATTIDPRVAADIVLRLRGALPSASFGLETLEGFAMEPSYAQLYDGGTNEAVRSGRIDDLLAGGVGMGAPEVVKILVRVPGTRSDDLLALARPLLSGVAAPTHSNAADGLLEICALGVSKAAALGRLCAHLGIDRADVAAFGDMPNDIEMLRWAGQSYAMTGGHPEAVAAAKALAPPCEEDGVAQVVEVLLAGGRMG
jgi:Cof subfamily protein (haloacid dehalogenase superfamily)